MSQRTDDDTASGMPNREAFELLVQTANTGDEQALTELRKLLDENPIIWQSVGDLAQHAQLALLRAIANGDQLLFESVSRTAEELRQELLGPSPSKLEELAVERIVACWLEMKFIETSYPLPKGDNLLEAKFALQQKESAQRRYESSIRSLAQIRKLLPPAVIDNTTTNKPSAKRSKCVSRAASNTKNGAARTPALPLPKFLQGHDRLTANLWEEN